MGFDLTKRSDVVAFYGIKGSANTVTYHRMKGFTEISTSLNPKEYTRQYVDEDFERTDVTGYGRSISYAMDELTDDPVQKDLISVEEDELTGSAAVREIVMVYLNKPVSGGEGAYEARKRSFTVIPDSSGDSLDAMTHSGTLRANGDMVIGKATTTDEWQTMTFTEDTE